MPFPPEALASPKPLNQRWMPTLNRNHPTLALPRDTPLHSHLTPNHATRVWHHPNLRPALPLDPVLDPVAVNAIGKEAMDLTTLENLLRN